ncbi:hypothetical protein DMB42_39890 [Nonomuraea sp. WAC 01424]|uniref:hypothetical protein n=1 Tax=Nonomuraea sp. WAC 01424 TaxID=2203200 RepID=UPI000F76C32E|nr:hypothetical protein [Nonomuraea sp. WAC 01424]RSN01155.1 hypothetical protein DMB42_39890 [Nonomuraea sp. WAC 01424]
MNRQVDDVVRRLAPAPGPGLTAGARETMYQIMEEEPDTALPVRGRRRRGLIALPIAAGAIAASLAAFLALAPAAASALDIKEEDGYYLVEVKDVFADPEAYQRQLREAGLDITLRMLPAPPSQVGTFDPTASEPDGIEVIRQDGCERREGCPIRMKVRRDFAGSAEIILGRQARPGEEYEINIGFDSPGEPMHCVPFHNSPVSEVRGLLKARGLDVQAFDVLGPAFWTKGGKDTPPETKTSVPESTHVVGGYLTMPGKATLQVSDSDLPDDLVRTLKAKAGCP